MDYAGYFCYVVRLHVQEMRHSRCVRLETGYFIPIGFDTQNSNMNFKFATEVSESRKIEYLR